MFYGIYASQNPKTNLFINAIIDLSPKEIQNSSLSRAALGAVIGGALGKIALTTTITYAVTSFTGKQQVKLTKNITIDWSGKKNLK